MNRCQAVKQNELIYDKQELALSVWNEMQECYHGLRTLNEGKNQRNLKILADVADKICFSRN